MRASQILGVMLFAASCAVSCAPRVYLPARASAPRQGDGSLRVVVQEAGDFECPFCALADPTVHALMTAYAGRVAFVWRNYPLPRHPHAELAAEAALEVRAQGGDAKFWAYHDVLFAHHDALGREALEKYAEDLGGVDLERFRAALDTHAHLPEIRADFDAITHAADVGAPAFFIDGRVIEGAQPYEVFAEAIDEALARAR